MAVDVHCPASAAGAVDEGDNLPKVLRQIRVGRVTFVDVHPLLDVLPIGWRNLIANAQDGGDAIAHEEGFLLERVRPTEEERGRIEDTRRWWNREEADTKTGLSNEISGRQKLKSE